MTPKLELLSEPAPLAGTLARPHGLLEAPRATRDGAVLYTDILQGGAFRVRGDAAPVTAVPKRRGVGGQLPHADGGVALSGRTVIHSRQGSDRELLALGGVAGFNDMISDDAGAVYVGALRFKPFLGEHAVPSEVWRIAGEGEPRIAAEGIDWPNGIGFSPDGSRMYVSDTAHGAIRVYESGPTAGEIFATVASGTVDGLAVDEEGAVWVALGDAGIARFDHRGNLDGIADVPSNFVSSLCFGGEDRRDVYITTGDNLSQPELGGAVFRARCEVAGRPVADARV